MMQREMEKDFLQVVANHQMQVRRDDDVYRHLIFKRPGTYTHHISLVTFPGCLVISGDFDTYVFERTHDMFMFFRPDPNHSADGALYTNHDYWSEKLIASDCNGRYRGGGVTEFDSDAFTSYIRQKRLEWVRDGKRFGLLNKTARRALWEAVQDDILDRVDPDDGGYALRLAYEFHWREDFCFLDLYESDFQRYTHGFQWACLAVAWGIRQYDAWKAGMHDALHAAR
jgi:hypothetical protein